MDYTLAYGVCSSKWCGVCLGPWNAGILGKGHLLAGEGDLADEGGLAGAVCTSVAKSARVGGRAQLR